MKDVIKIMEYILKHDLNRACTPEKLQEKFKPHQYKKFEKYCLSSQGGKSYIVKQHVDKKDVYIITSEGMRALFSLKNTKSLQEFSISTIILTFGLMLFAVINLMIFAYTQGFGEFVLGSFIMLIILATPITYYLSKY